MGKRFTDTEKWKKPFIKGLLPAYKLLWFYILDECNHAGIWDVEWEIAKIRIGTAIDIDIAKKQFGEKIQIIDENRWFIPSFIDFQYGDLNPENRVHKSVLQYLGKFKIKPLESPFDGAKDKDKDKDKDKYKDGIKFFSVEYFEEQGYTFGLTPSAQQAMNEFLEYRAKRKEKITDGKVVEKIIKEMFVKTSNQDDWVKMIDFTISKSAKNVITNIEIKTSSERLRTQADFYEYFQYVDYCKKKGITPDPQETA